MEIVLFLIILGIVKCWVEYRHDKHTKKILEQGAERFRRRSALENDGYTVVTCANTGRIISYFKSGQALKGG